MILIRCFCISFSFLHKKRNVQLVNRFYDFSFGKIHNTACGCFHMLVAVFFLYFFFANDIFQFVMFRFFPGCHKWRYHIWIKPLVATSFVLIASLDDSVLLANAAYLSCEYFFLSIVCPFCLTFSSINKQINGKKFKFICKFFLLLAIITVFVFIILPKRFSFVFISLGTKIKI